MQAYISSIWIDPRTLITDGRSIRTGRPKPFGSNQLGFNRLIQTHCYLPPTHRSINRNSWYNNEEFLSNLQDEIDRYCSFDFNRTGSTSIQKKNEILSGYIKKQGLVRKDKFKLFWKWFRTRYNHLDQRQMDFFVKDLQRLLRNRQKRLIERTKRNCGILPKSSRAKKDNMYRLPFSFRSLRQFPKGFFDFIPDLDIKSVTTKSNVERLQQLQESMDEVINPKRLSRRKGHLGKIQGFSLANTVFPGGGALKAHNLKGSGPINRSPFWKKYKLEHIEKEFLDLVSDVINEAFARSEWYQVLKEKLSLIPDNRFIKGAKVPISNIWWTRCPSENNIHTDGNVVGAVFIFCTKRYEGGDLIVGTPAKYGHVISLEPGKIVGGRFSEYSHGTTPAEQARHSLVCYLDFRMLCPNYKFIGNE